MCVRNDYKDDKRETGVLVTVSNLVYVKCPATHRQPGEEGLGTYSYGWLVWLASTTGHTHQPTGCHFTQASSNH